MMLENEADAWSQRVLCALWEAAAGYRADRVLRRGVMGSDGYHCQLPPGAMCADASQASKIKGRSFDWK